jgi:hypothetical protein
MYEPPEDFHGADSFTYTVDGLMQATVQVQVIRRVRDDQFRVEGDAVAEPLPVLVNDLFGADYRGARRITAVTDAAAGGAVSVGADGRTIEYTPPAGLRARTRSRTRSTGPLRPRSASSSRRVRAMRFRASAAFRSINSS